MIYDHKFNFGFSPKNAHFMSCLLPSVGFFEWTAHVLKPSTESNVIHKACYTQKNGII